MKKIILSNFLESKENYELFKEKIAHLNLCEYIDSFLFNDGLTKTEKINHIINKFFEPSSSFKNIIESLDYSITEKQMLIFCYNSADRYDLLNLLKVDLIADLENYKWSEEKTEIVDSVYQDLLNIDENQTLMNLNDSAFDDFWEDKENKVIYFVIGDALFSYSKETGGFNVMKISSYSDLKTYIQKIATDKQPIVNGDFTDEFLSKVDTSNLNDYLNISSWIDNWIEDEENTLWDNNLPLEDDDINNEKINISVINFTNKEAGSFYCEVIAHGEKMEFIGELDLDNKLVNIEYVAEKYENVINDWFQKNESEVLNKVLIAYFELDEFDANSLNETTQIFFNKLNSWYGYAMALCNYWYGATENEIKILDKFYPWKQSFDDFLNEVLFNINNAAKYNIELNKKFWDESNEEVSKTINESTKYDFNKIVQNFAANSEELEYYLDNVQINKLPLIENQETQNLYQFIKTVIGNDSVSVWINWIRSNTK